MEHCVANRTSQSFTELRECVGTEIVCSRTNISNMPLVVPQNMPISLRYRTDRFCLKVKLWRLFLLLPLKLHYGTSLSELFYVQLKLGGLASDLGSATN